MKNSIIISTVAAIIISIALSVSLSSCISTRDTVKINKVEMGMTKNDIQNLLGTPYSRMPTRLARNGATAS